MKKIIASVLLIVLMNIIYTVHAQEASNYHNVLGNEIEITKIEKISPNPIDDIVTINLLSKDYSDKIEIRVLNIIGSTVRKFQVDEAQAIQLNLEDLSSGPYILSVYENGRHIDSQRIIK